MLRKQVKGQNERIKKEVDSLHSTRLLYEESLQKYADLNEQMTEVVKQQTETMENERRHRLDKFADLATDIRILEQLFAWQDQHNEHFQKACPYCNIGKLHGVLGRLKNQLQHSLLVEDEINYLLQYLPEYFSSKKLFADLQTILKNEKINSANAPNRQILYDRFCLLEQALRETAMTPSPKPTLFENLLAKLAGSFLFQEHLPRTGNDPQARISRAGFAIRSGDIKAGLDELEYLEGLF
ncbi:hypothetical protein RFI_08820 [Reticulomyxa filosa]|uniref:Uncharacterized protein n=1 Tax=Reticulomyxa filosa TaxID=46433 RepID=X6NQW4_RETFI|nr:hypothetical protein RFI_08820 [Reticulomyxa filosa]|eukprot:ETO28313.1 hypothetical protein RFI_08820 [Reticulomyxa filosa]